MTPSQVDSLIDAAVCLITALFFARIAFWAWRRSRAAGPTGEDLLAHAEREMRDVPDLTVLAPLYPGAPDPESWRTR